MAKSKGIKAMKQITKDVKGLQPASTNLGATLGKLPKVSAASTVIKRKPKEESIGNFMARRNKGK